MVDTVSEWSLDWLPDSARRLVDEIRRAGPSRAVHSGPGSVSGRFPSRKMGVTIQFESHRNELAFILELEHDDDILGYYDQPPPIPLRYAGKDGRDIRVTHTPDFFVVSRAFTGWVECKTEAELVRLAGRQPNRFRMDEHGRWRCPPGEAWAAESGLAYRVRSSAETNPVLASNLRFLDDYLRAETLSVPQVLIDLAQSFVVARPGIPLSELLSFFTLRGLAPDGLYALLLTGHLFADLAQDRLTEPESVRLFVDRDAAVMRSAPLRVGGVTFPLTPGEVLIWDGRPHTLVNRGEQENWLLPADGPLVRLSDKELRQLLATGAATVAFRSAPERLADQRLLKASPTDLAEANRRYAVLRGETTDVSARTRRDWRARFRRAEQETGIGFLGLLPETGRSGNRTDRLKPGVRELADRLIRECYENPRQPNRHSVWARLVAACAEASLPAPSYKTFRRMIARRDETDQVGARRGPRAAYQVRPVDPARLEFTTPRHGERPFEIGHIDHTRLDIELVCSQTGQPLGHPWMTLLTDAFSRRILAVGLSYDPPSYRACMSIIRECVRRFQRLPSILMTDGGKEFQSRYYESLLAAYEITKKIRPPSEARFGSVCERVFGTTNTRFINTLIGNTQGGVEHLRLATGKFAPRRQAAWTLEALWPLLVKFAYETYDRIHHPALGQSPADAFGQGMATFGHREFRVIADDADFLMMTMPTTPSGEATVTRGRGIKINIIFYWSAQFGRADLIGRKVPVRYDPEDAGRAWCFIDGGWTECRSQFHPVFHNRSEREIQLATAELRKRLSERQRHVKITAVQLAEFLRETEKTEKELLARQRAKANPKRKPTTREVPETETPEAPARLPRFRPDQLDILKPLE